MAAPPVPPGQFFSPWEPPPTYAPPPTDAALVERISLLVKYAQRQGPPFIDMMKEKQQGDEKFAFLFGGEGYHYWRWALYCALYNLPADQPPPGPVYTPAAAPVAASTPQMPSQPAVAAPGAQPLPAEVETGFGQVLEALTGSKDSIKSSSHWFIACAAYAGGLARMMARRVIQLPDYDRQLHVVYLANDILFKSLGQRAAGADFKSDAIASAFLPALGPMLAAAFVQGGRTEEVKVRLSKILHFWAERSVYDAATTASLEAAMTSIMDPAQALDQAPAPAPATPQSTAAPQPAASAAPPYQYHAAPPAGPAPSPMAMPYAQAPPHDQGSMAWPPQGIPPSAMGQWQPPPGHPASHLPHPGPHMAQPPYLTMPVPGMPGAPGMLPPGQQGLPPHAPGPWGPMPPPGAPPPAGVPMAAPSYGAPPPAVQAVWYPPPPGAPGAPHMGPPPGAFHGVPPPVHLPFPSEPGAAMGAAGMPTTPPAPQPTSSFTFPPGLLPKLSQDKNRHSAPYTPLDPVDIEQAGLPPPPEKDGYLQSRLERFFAEIRDYRPGTTRADLEDVPRDRNRERDQDEEEWERGGGAGRGRGGRRSGFDASGEAGMQSDGSFVGLGGSQYGGLGSHSTAASRTSDDLSMDDMYGQYRKARSGHYHETILKTTTSNIARGGR